MSRRWRRGRTSAPRILWPGTARRWIRRWRRRWRRMSRPTRGRCLLLAFLSMQSLPVNYAGLLLMLFGLALLMLEVKVASYGLLTAGGLASLLFGSMILSDSPVPELRVSLRLVLPIVFGVGAI